MIHLWAFMPRYWASVERTPWAARLFLDRILNMRHRGKHRPGPIGSHDLVFPGALRVGATMACLEGETIDRITALIESSRALSGVLALVLASTPPGELSASEMDALTDLSYEIHRNLDQLDEIWEQVGR